MDIITIVHTISAYIILQRTLTLTFVTSIDDNNDVYAKKAVNDFKWAESFKIVTCVLEHNHYIIYYYKRVATYMF